jgi:hypothetical protein
MDFKGFGLNRVPCSTDLHSQEASFGNVDRPSQWVILSIVLRIDVRTEHAPGTKQIHGSHLTKWAYYLADSGERKYHILHPGKRMRLSVWDRGHGSWVPDDNPHH